MSSFIYQTSVRFHDVDFAGIVFFARIFFYAHDAYEAWLRSIGCYLEIPVAERGYALPFVHAEADYHEPLRAGQNVSIEVTPIAVGKSSYTLKARIRTEPDTCNATVTTVTVCADPQTRRSQPLPDELRKAIEAQIPKDAGSGIED